MNLFAIVMLMAIVLTACGTKKQVAQSTGKSYFEQFTPVEKPIREDFISTKSPSSKIVLATIGPQNSNPKENLKKFLVYLVVGLSGFIALVTVPNKDALTLLIPIILSLKTGSFNSPRISISPNNL